MTRSSSSTSPWSFSSRSRSFAPLAIVAASIVGCAAPQRVAYSVENLPRVKGSPAAQVALVVAPLKDVRKTIAANAVLFSLANEATIHGKDYCINAESGYDPEPVSNQITKMLAAHLRSRGALRAVSVGARAEGAYYLTGTLRRYYGQQESTATSPATYALFGAIGAVVAAAATPDKAPGKVSIEVVELILYDTTGKPIMRLPDILLNEQLRMRAATDCLVIYDNINQQLKRMLGSYANTIEASIANAMNTGTAPAASSPQPAPSPSALAVSVAPTPQPAATVGTQPGAATPASTSTASDAVPPAEPW